MSIGAFIGKLNTNGSVDYINVWNIDPVEDFDKLVTDFKTDELVTELLSKGNSYGLNNDFHADTPFKTSATIAEYVQELRRPDMKVGYLFMHGAWTMLNPNKTILGEG